ncbi:Maf-like protein [Ascidiimonas aurantiaca]|uniref:Maf-like protein n=1 Tax=Ascidiimonas aurantiaca TaxID=1685432 RepID=UPI0030EE22C6
MLRELLKGHHIILASGSPRRQQFLKDLGLDFEIRLKPVDEVYPQRLKGFEISDYLAQLKALPFKSELKEKEILITSDTIVWHRNKALGKPRSEEEAINMIRSLSGDVHEVITSLCITTTTVQKTIHATTKVHFKELTDKEIIYYVTQFKPFDKAGAYGIQEWIGFIGIDRIEGSYFNVVGLPVHLLYEQLLKIKEYGS